MLQVYEGRGPYLPVADEPAIVIDAEQSDSAARTASGRFAIGSGPAPLTRCIVMCRAGAAFVGMRSRPAARPAALCCRLSKVQGVSGANHRMFRAVPPRAA